MTRWRMVDVDVLDNGDNGLAVGLGGFAGVSE